MIGKREFGASTNGVAGVTADSTFDRDELGVAFANGSAASFVAAPYPRPIPNVPRERNLSGVSFAVANATGFLARAAESCGGDAVDALALLRDGGA